MWSYFYRGSIIINNNDEIEEYLKIVRPIIGRYTNYNIWLDDDLKQEARLAIIEALKRNKDHPNFKGYMILIVKGFLDRLVRKDNKYVPIYNKDLEELESCSYNFELEFKDWFEVLKLTDLEIKILQYKLIGYKNVDIAKELKCSRVWITKIMTRIRAKWENYYIK